MADPGEGLLSQGWASLSEICSKDLTELELINGLGDAVDARVCREDGSLRESLAYLAQEQGGSAEKRLRIHVYNTCCGQVLTDSEFDAAQSDCWLQKTMPSWTLRIEGAIVDTPVQSLGGQQSPPTKASPTFSSLIDKVVVSWDEETVIWQNNLSSCSTTTIQKKNFDGLEINRIGMTEFDIRIIIFLSQRSPIYGLSPLLTQVLQIQHGSLAAVVRSLWRYIQIEKLQLPNAPESIRCDYFLAQMSGCPVGRDINVIDLPSLVVPHLRPASPIVVVHRLSLQGDGASGDHEAFDVMVDFPDELPCSYMAEAIAKSLFCPAAADKFREAALQKTAAATAEARAVALREKICDHLARRNYLSALNSSPINFVQNLLNGKFSDDRSIGVGAGDGAHRQKTSASTKKVLSREKLLDQNFLDHHSIKDLECSFYKQPWVVDATQRYLDLQASPLHDQLRRFSVAVESLATASRMYFSPTMMMLGAGSAHHRNFRRFRRTAGPYGTHPALMAAAAHGMRHSGFGMMHTGAPNLVPTGMPTSAGMMVATGSGAGSFGLLPPAPQSAFHAGGMHGGGADMTPMGVMHQSAAAQGVSISGHHQQHGASVQMRQPQHQHESIAAGQHMQHQQQQLQQHTRYFGPQDGAGGGMNQTASTRSDQVTQHHHPNHPSSLGTNTSIDTAASRLYQQQVSNANFAKGPPSGEATDAGSRVGADSSDAGIVGAGTTTTSTASYMHSHQVVPGGGGGGVGRGSSSGVESISGEMKEHPSPCGVAHRLLSTVAGQVETGGSTRGSQAGSGAGVYHHRQHMPMGGGGGGEGGARRGVPVSAVTQFGHDQHQHHHRGVGGGGQQQHHHQQLHHQQMALRVQQLQQQQQVVAQQQVQRLSSGGVVGQQRQFVVPQQQQLYHHQHQFQEQNNISVQQQQQPTQPEFQRPGGAVLAQHHHPQQQQQLHAHQLQQHATALHHQRHHQAQAPQQDQF